MHPKSLTQKNKNKLTTKYDFRTKLASGNKRDNQILCMSRKPKAVIEYQSMATHHTTNEP